MKYILVTGSNSGIGQGILKYLVNKDYPVIAHYHSKCDNIDQILASSGSGNNNFKFQADLRDLQSVKEMFLFIKKKGIKLYGLVNNAGIAKDRMILWLTEKDWDDVLDLNLKGAFFCIKHSLSIMIPNKTGRIINITSPSGILGQQGQANYSSSKGGLVALTKSVAKETASLGITANAVCPGIIKTKMYEALKENQREQFIDMIPLKRPGDVEEVAGIVEYLLRDEASYITGAVLRVDGGLTIS